MSNEMNLKSFLKENNIYFEIKKGDIHVGGPLDLEGSNITELPEGLHVGGSLYLEGSNITELPEGLHVGGSLDLEGSNITELPEGLHVGGPLYLEGSNITELPEGLHVGGSLYLDPEKQMGNITAFRKNCGFHNRTIYCVFINNEYKISAGCFFGSLNEFCRRVEEKYSSEQAKDYIAKAQECIDEVREKVSTGEKSVANAN